MVVGTGGVLPGPVQSQASIMPTRWAYLHQYPGELTSSQESVHAHMHTL
jgi:hypothetical protein